ncbi:serine carboxypeptidase-like 12 isoform X5 [Raphanus sativus]|uniref:Serine carboxypeptidase-like 12 isoform X5 n=1 Tax=Raphanus sativus TaxID=3726 RepID=A0A9W3BV55_RAPSA|nr:serine carboxypeptidase-like 12 isoform X5 [Raphanus sativus]
MSLTLKLLLLLLLLFVLSHHVDSGSIVKFLPGFEGPLPFELETGYIGIGEEEDIQLFYYFIKSEKNPKEDPLLIWLNGGPGCSSLLGLLFENGPLAFKFEVYNGDLASLVSTTYSWTQVANIIFLDQPVGSGFSYSRTPLDKTSDTNEVKMIHEFLQKWLSKHPQFFSNPFYVIGDSYSGKIVPALVQKISKGNYICCKPLINLQGYVLGNPVTYPEFELNYRIPFSHGMSLISDELYESLNTNCKGVYVNVDPRNTKCLELVAEYHKIAMMTKIRKIYLLIAIGDHDMTMPSLATQAWIKSLNYSIIDDWRPWMIKAQIAGYTRTYSNKMTFSTIKRFDYREVDTRQSINQTRHLLCFKGGSVISLCNRDLWL